MVGKRQAGQTLRAQRWQALCVGCVLNLALTMMTGCTHTPTTAQPNLDPLIGVRTPPGTPMGPSVPAVPTSATPTQTQTSSVGGVPPIPTTLSASNTATIAGNYWQTPGSLAINDKAPAVRLGTPGQLTNEAKTPQTPVAPGFPAPNPNPRVEPIPDAKPGASSALQPGIPSGGQAITPTGVWQAPPFTALNSVPVSQTSQLTPAVSMERDLMKRLQDSGVINEKRDTVPEGIHLTCYLTRGSEGIRIVEVTAADYSTAAQLILQQLVPVR